MPVINPLPLVNKDQVKEVLQLVKKDQQKKSLTEILDFNGMSIDDIVRTAADTMTGGETTALRMKAAEFGAKLHGLMETENVKPQPIVNIIIKDTRLSDVNGLNPILVPRS